MTDNVINLGHKKLEDRIEEIIETIGTKQTPSAEWINDVPIAIYHSQSRISHKLTGFRVDIEVPAKCRGYLYVEEEREKLAGFVSDVMLEYMGELAEAKKI